MQNLTLSIGLQRVRLWSGVLLAAVVACLAPRASAQDAIPEKALIKITQPRTGASIDAPGPVVIEGHAIDPAGDIRHIELYANDKLIGTSDFLSKIATIPGMTIPHRLVWEGVAPGTYILVGRGKDTLGNPVESEPVKFEVTTPVSGRFKFVSFGAEWRYSNDGVDYGEKWRDPAFADGAWSGGLGQLGYGDGDEETRTRPDEPPHPMTAYFRHVFQAPADLAVARLEIQLVRDDGAAVYLNGKELLRDNLPDGPLAFGTPALDSTEGENRARTFTVPAEALVVGPNLLAVEVHQASATSSDLSFDLQLVGLSTATPPLPVPTVSLVGLNLATSESRPEARIAPGRLSLRRTGDTDRPLPVFLSLDGSAIPGSDYEKLEIPTVIPAGKSEIEVFIQAADDDAVEGTELVIVEIVPSPAAGPLPTYEIDAKNHRVEVAIHDADLPRNAALIITSPEPGARLPEGKTIPVSVTAYDPEGYINRVELFDGDTRVGVSEIVFIVAPEPGTVIRHEIEWKNPAVGIHKLSARAGIEDTRLTSQIVEVEVGGTPPADSWLLNINFGLNTRKVGTAATGLTAGDYWNPWESVGQAEVTTEDLLLASGAKSRVDLRVRNAGGSWNNKTGDGMYDSYVYPNSGGGDGVGDIGVTLESVPAGTYDLYLYGHADPDGRPESDSVFVVDAGNSRFGPLGTKSSAGWTVSDGWKEGAQFVVFRDLVVREGAPIQITVQAGFDGQPFPGVPAQYVAILNGLQLIRSGGTPPAGDATLTLTSPLPGAVFAPGLPIDLHATAIDPKGYIPRVEFLDGDKVVAVSEIAFLVAPPDGSPIEHHAEWVGAEPGEHVIRARAVDAAGKEIRSDKIPIIVGDAPSPVILEVTVADPEAREPGNGQGSNTATFVIRRIGGPKDVDVTAYFQIEGSAQNGTDYVKLDSSAPLRSGRESIEIVVRALPDRLQEPTESVSLTLLSPPCIAIFPAPPQCYQIGANSSAKVTILDADGVKDENSAPAVTITAPKSGAVHSQGDVIELAAEATDADGKIERLDLFADDTLVGSAKEGKVTATWKDASLGMHRITARAVDDRGSETTTRPTLVFVRSAEERAFVRRDLPPAYLPGAVVEVQLQVDPPRGAAAWIVEDAPPAGWAVSDISDDGVFDTSVGKVKFGPYTDGKERILTYKVTAPAGATGDQKFAGTTSLDGETYPLAGEDTLAPAGLHHPADAPSANNGISGNEVTAYAAAWKLGRDWAGSGSIPLSYVTRAGFLWRSGEAYLFDAGRGAPPECWVPAGPRRPAALAGVAPAGGKGTSERGLPESWRPGKSGLVQLRIQPPAGTFATAVEEILPPGWRATDISDAGTYDSATRTLRWGILDGDGTRTLSYKAIPPSDAACTGSFAGRISFDGSEAAILGVHSAGATDESTALRIVGSRKEKGGKAHLRVEASAQQVFVVEGSSDLVHWSEVSAHVFTGEEIEVNDPPTGNDSGHRYYRLRPVGR